MFYLFPSFLCSWITLSLALVLYILLSKPGKFLLDLNTIYFRLPLPNVNDNAYTRNKRLVQCEKIQTEKINCPKSIAIDKDGKLYTGNLNGDVYCLNDDVLELIKNFPNGRPLGMRISKNVLYFIEANTGLYSYHLENKSIKHLLDRTKTIFLDGKPSKFFDDLVVVEEDQNTIIFITDVSRKFPIDMWCYTYLEPDSSGRILRYDVLNDQVTVVIENLCFPNGIEVTDNKESLLVCELSKRRILRHYIKGSNTGLTTVLINNLPGEPENIRRSLNTTNETYWIGLALTRDYNNQLSFLDDYSTQPNLRKLILRTCFILGSILYYCGDLINNSALKNNGQNLKTGLALILSDFMSNPGMALEVDLNSIVLLSIQVKDDISVISELKEIPTNDDTRVLYTTSSGGSLGKIVLSK